MLISHGRSHILIDAGISFKRIRIALEALGVGVADVSAVLLTHGHSDHVCGIATLSKHMPAQIFATRGTLDKIVCKAAPNADLVEIEPNIAFEAREFEVRAFSTSHDAPGSVGYTVTCAGKKLVLATDLGIVTQEVYDAAAGAHLAILEANHDPTMLRCGYYPPSLKRRIMSDYGHLSNKAGGEFAMSLVRAGAQRIVLAHLSRDNNTPELAAEAVCDSFRRGGAKVGADVELTVAPKDCVGETFEI